MRAWTEWKLGPRQSSSRGERRPTIQADSALLDQTCQHRRETSFILARLAFETVIVIRYLIQKFSADLIRSYREYSFRHEKKLRDTILRNIDARGGEQWAIEERMLRSIERAAKISGVRLDEIDLNDKRSVGWGEHLSKRRRRLGLREAYLDRNTCGPSHSIHVNWHDLYEYHLEESRDGFASSAI